MDYLRWTWIITVGLAISGSNIGPCLAVPAQELVLSGRLLGGTGSSGPMAVRLRCQDFQTETRTTGSGLFTVRIPRRSYNGASTVPAISSRGGFAHDPSSMDTLRGSLECTLEVVDRHTVLTRLELSVPEQSRRVDLGDLALPDRVDHTPGARFTVSWRSLTAAPEASAACAEARKELSRSQPDLARAHELLDRALRIDPDIPEGWGLLGIVEAAQGNSGVARSDFEKALELDASSPEVHTFLAQLDMREQKWREALEHCDSALKIEPGRLQAEYIRAFAAYNLGDFETARTASRRVRTGRESSRFADILVVDALLLAQEGKTQEAAAMFRSFLDQHPDYANRAAIEHQLALWEKSESGCQ